MKTLLKLSLLPLALMLFACGGTPQADATETEPTTTEVAKVNSAPTGLAIGEKAPDFELMGTDGKAHSLASTMVNGEAPKGYILTFTCNTCPFAKGYESRLVALHEKMSAMGYPVVAVQPNDVTLKPGDNLEAMKVRAEEKGFDFAYLLDDKQSVYPQYGATKTPEIYLLDADMVLRYHGAIDDSAQDPEAVTVNYVESAIAALEKGETPEPQEVKAIGCSIKAK